MTPPIDAPSLDIWVALPLRLAVALALAWAGALVTLMVAQRADAADPRVQRSWLAVGLLALVAELDRLSLVAGRRLTIPFVRQVLERESLSCQSV